MLHGIDISNWQKGLQLPAQLGEIEGVAFDGGQMYLINGSIIYY